MTAEDLVNKYLGMAYNLALRLTGNASDAEDLSQDALCKAVKGLPGLRNETGAGVWVYRIVVNTWKNSLRSPGKKFWKKLFTIDREEEAARQFPDPAPGPDAGLEAREEKRAYEDALNALGPEDRAMLILRELDGLSYAEIAGTFDIPEGTVKSRLFRAREKLRTILKPYLEEK